ncbi:MAG: Cof-type HAD-IIB family hydrolase [Bacillales bacterium]|jgi:Cof subfamily protein (haloacid dehalogenase superfamily)|nr:Cof-type HAD-IIB family hydrolase [Bacillales bacterium]
MINTVFVDLDGTILIDSKTLHPETKEYLIELKDKGYNVVIATGRPLRASKKFYDELNLNTPIINYNGASVSWPNSQKEGFYTFVKKDFIIDLEKRFPLILNILCESEEKLYEYFEDDLLRKFYWQDNCDTRLGKMEKILDTNPYICIVQVKDVKYKSLIKDYIINNSDYFIRFWEGEHNDYGEIFPKNIDKFYGVKVVSKLLGINPSEQALAIGDAGNDISMIKGCKIGVAMKNSEIELLKVAKYVTKETNINGGVKEFLNQFLKV